MKRWQLTITLLSPWHAGSGLGDGPGDDRLVVRDAHGMPYLPGRTLKGLLRDATTAAEELGHLNAGVTVRLFGEASSQTGDAESEGSLLLGDARLGGDVAAVDGWDRWAAAHPDQVRHLDTRIQSTAVEDGVGKRGTLRSTEWIWPATLTAILASDAKKAEEDIQSLEKSLALLRRLGLRRHRGFGNATFTLQPIDEAEAETAREGSTRSEPPSRHLTIDVTVRRRATVSRRGRTEGGHETLDYLPGATLLGVAARGLYPSSKAEDAWVLFHSGKVRFGDARPRAADGSRSLPAPRSWHVTKLDPKGTIYDLSAQQHGFPTEAGAPKQLREGYVDARGEAVTRPSTRLDAHQSNGRRHLSGAGIDGSRKVPALFHTEALTGTPSFRAEIHADDDVSEKLLNDLAEALRGGHARLGKGRSHQGEVDLTVKSSAAPGRKDEEVRGATVHVHCLSDLQLRDPETGEPTLLPTAQHFGWAVGTLDLDRTFLRSRRFSRYNGKRRARDPERQVIEAGSVLCFEGVDGSVPETAYVGEDWGYGSGEVRFAVPSPPNTQRADVPRTGDAADPSPQVPATDDAAPPEDAPNAHLVALVARESARAAQAAKIRSALATWRPQLDKARSRCEALGTSQWRNLQDLAAQATSTTHLRGALLHRPAEGDSTEPGWLRRGARARAWEPLRETLKMLLIDSDLADIAPAVVERLAADMAVATQRDKHTAPKEAR